MVGGSKESGGVGLDCRSGMGMDGSFLRRWEDRRGFVYASLCRVQKFVLAASQDHGTERKSQTPEDSRRNKTMRGVRKLDSLQEAFPAREHNYHEEQS